MAVSRLVCALLFFCAATGLSSFSVTTTTPNVSVKENENVDLKCTASGDFGSSPGLRWKFKDKKGSQVYVVFDGIPTEPYTSRVQVYGGTNMRISKVTRNDNGVYTCEVSSPDKVKFGDADVTLTVLVPPSVPMCNVPKSVTTGSSAILTCHDETGSPPPTYSWYKNGVLLPADPSKNAAFRNATYKLDENTGKLEFRAATKLDTGEYYCEAVNIAGPAQRSRAINMEVRDINAGGIAAGVIVALLLVALLIFGIWYAKKRGYLPTKSENKTNRSTVYQPAMGDGGDDFDAEFKQKSSFVV